MSDKVSAVMASGVVDFVFHISYLLVMINQICMCMANLKIPAIITLFFFRYNATICYANVACLNNDE